MKRLGGELNYRHFIEVPYNEQWIANEIYKNGSPFGSLVKSDGYYIETMYLSSGSYSTDNKIIFEWVE